MSSSNLAGVAIVCAVILLPATLEGQQTYTYRGTAACTNSECHKREKMWFDNEDGPPPNQHRRAFEQLTREPAKSAKYAASIGVTNPQDAGGRCVECHAPPQRSRFNDGVSCEVCHGPGSGYFDVHDDQPYKTNGYPQAVKRGLLALLENPNIWAQQCINCHVVRESRLIDAGHPSGDDFDLATKSRLTASSNGNHWRTNYSARSDEIRRLAMQFGNPIRSARAKPIPAPAAPGGIPDPVATAAPTLGPAPALPPQPDAPTAPPPAITTGGGATVAPSLPTPVSPTARVRPSPAVPPAPATFTPAPARAPVSPSGASMYAGPMEPLPPAVLPRSPAALVAFIQGRAIEIVTALLSRGSVVSVPADTVSSPPPYSGPDAELIRLQQDVLRLGLEALRSKSVNSQAPK